MYVFVCARFCAQDYIVVCMKTGRVSSLQVVMLAQTDLHKAVLNCVVCCTFSKLTKCCSVKQGDITAVPELAHYLKLQK